MDVQQVLDQLREQVGPKHVFGEPIREGDVVVVPVAKVRGGGGGGGNGSGEGKATGQGVGFGIAAVPAGAFVFKQGKLSWQPAIDVNRVILGAQILAAVALLTMGSFLRQRARRRFFWRWV